MKYIYCLLVAALLVSYRTTVNADCDPVLSCACQNMPAAFDWFRTSYSAINGTFRNIVTLCDTHGIPNGIQLGIFTSATNMFIDAVDQKIRITGDQSILGSYWYLPGTSGTNGGAQVYLETNVPFGSDTLGYVVSRAHNADSTQWCTRLRSNSSQEQQLYLNGVFLVGKGGKGPNILPLVSCAYQGQASDVTAEGKLLSTEFSVDLLGRTFLWDFSGPYPNDIPFVQTSSRIVWDPALFISGRPAASNFVLSSLCQSIAG